MVNQSVITQRIISQKRLQDEKVKEVRRLRQIQLSGARTIKMFGSFKNFNNALRNAKNEVRNVKSRIDNMRRKRTNITLKHKKDLQPQKDRELQRLKEGAQRKRLAREQAGVIDKKISISEAKARAKQDLNIISQKNKIKQLQRVREQNITLRAVEESKRKAFEKNLISQEIKTIKEIKSFQDRLKQKKPTARKVEVKPLEQIARVSAKEFAKGVGTAIFEIAALPVKAIGGAYNYGRRQTKDAFKNDESVAKTFGRDVVKVSKGTLSVAKFTKDNPLIAASIVGAYATSTGESLKNAFIKNPSRVTGQAIVFLFPGTIIKGVKKAGQGISKKAFSVNSARDVLSLPKGVPATEITLSKTKLISDLEKKIALENRVAKSKANKNIVKAADKNIKILKQTKSKVIKIKKKELNSAQIKGLFRKFDEGFKPTPVNIVKSLKLKSKKEKIIKVPKPQLKKGVPTGKKALKFKKDKVKLLEFKPLKEKLSKKERKKVLTPEFIVDSRRLKGLKKIISEEASLGNVNFLTSRQIFNFKTLRKSKKGEVVPLRIQINKVSNGVKQTYSKFNKSFKKLKVRTKNLNLRYNRQLKESRNPKFTNQRRNKAQQDLQKIELQRSMIKNEIKIELKSFTSFEKSLIGISKLGFASLIKSIQSTSSIQDIPNIIKNLNNPIFPRKISKPKSPKKPPLKPRKPKTTKAPKKSKLPKTTKQPLKKFKVARFVKTIKKIKTLPILKFGLPQLKKGERYSYTLRYKERGKIKTIKTNLPKNKALRRIADLVDNTTIRSMEILLSGITKIKDSNIGKLNKFRLKRSKNKMVLKLVEKVKHAIDKPGEKKGLSLSKFLKNKRKKKFIKFKGKR